MGARFQNRFRHFFLLMLIGLISFSLRPAPAAYDANVHWSDMKDLDLGPALRSQYSSPSNLMEPRLPPGAHERVLADVHHRISQDFQIPEYLRPAVTFWLRIYTEYTTQHIAVFDSRHPEIVYEVIDLRELAKKSRNAIVFELVSKKRIKETLDAYRRAFRSLSRNPKPKNPTREESVILAQAQAHSHRHSFAEMARNLRTQTGQRDNIMKGLLAAEAFFPKMDLLFRDVGVPRELTRLALVESSFNLHAHSRKGAVGIWQFMQNPGAHYLRIDEKNGIDERLSPMKSTVAAALLLRENHRRFGNWALAVTSYNHGLRGLKKKGGHKLASLFDPCQKRSPLGWAGRNYYAEFLAVLYAESYRELYYGEPPSPKIQAIAFRPVDGKVSALKLAVENSISVQQFRLLNPDIKHLSKALPKGFIVALPAQRDELAPVASSVRDARQASLEKLLRRTRS